MSSVLIAWMKKKKTKKERKRKEAHEGKVTHVRVTVTLGSFDTRYAIIYYYNL